MIVAVDIGGTSIRIARVARDLGVPETVLALPTPADIGEPWGHERGDEAMKERLLEAARALPATVQLVHRLLRDERVDGRKRAAVLASLAYMALPFDLIPDRLPIIGRVDDIVIGAAALQVLIDDAGETIVREHWEASDRSLDALLGVIETVSGLVPKPLRRLLRIES